MASSMTSYMMPMLTLLRENYFVAHHFTNKPRAKIILLPFKILRLFLFLMYLYFLQMLDWNYQTNNYYGTFACNPLGILTAYYFTTNYFINSATKSQATKDRQSSFFVNHCRSRLSLLKETQWSLDYVRGTKGWQFWEDLFLFVISSYYSHLKTIFWSPGNRMFWEVGGRHILVTVWPCYTVQGQSLMLYHLYIYTV